MLGELIKDLRITCHLSHRTLSDGLCSEGMLKKKQAILAGLAETLPRDAVGAGNPLGQPYHL